MKQLQIELVEFVISANSRVQAGWIPSLRLKGIFPNCRKSIVISATTMDGYIWLHPLYGYSGSANVSLADWDRIMDKASIVIDKISPIELTPEIESKLIEYRERMMDGAKAKMERCQENRKEMKLSPFVPETVEVVFI